MTMSRTTRYKTITTVSPGLLTYIQGVFARMSMGLFLTAIVAYLVSHSPSAVCTIFETPLFYVAVFAPMGIAIYLQARLESLTSATANALFLIYAASLGVSLSSIFLIYDLPSITQTFLTTGLLFAVMSYYGYMTHADLTSFGSFLTMGLFGLVICSVINFFMKSSGMDFALSIIGSFIFIGLTAFDMQRIKWIYSEADHDEMRAKKAIMGALVLYLDFINLFLMLLRFFGKQRGKH